MVLLRIVMSARPRQRPLLSVVVPVLNERSTVCKALTRILDKTLSNVDIEVVVVESNSTDGSREIVLGFQPHPRLRVILEDRPQGKGFAVRKGLAAAQGDIILIQDADLEYDIDDYDALLEPILAGRTAFVLGTRHAGGMHIRDFAGQRWMSLLYNVGHWMLTGLINVLFRANLTDPFTMYKVFRSECIRRMNFGCNRFDFDCELVCKLLRNGYSPVEIPVKYSSRSFADGKKVRTFRDPPTWIRAIIRCRIQPRLERAPLSPFVPAQQEPEKWTSANADSFR